MSVSIQFVAHTVESAPVNDQVVSFNPITGEVTFWPEGLGFGPCVVMDGSDFDRLVAQTNAARAKFSPGWDAYLACEGVHGDDE